jgi:GT2 family glycosyltransferase
MDADDICSPDRLSTQRAAMEAEPSLGVVGCLVEAFSESTSDPVGQGMLRYVEWQNSLVTPGQHRREIFVEAPLCHPSAMLRRDALEAVGGYRSVDGPEDYDLWLRLDAAGYGLAKVPRLMLRWRHSSDRATFQDPRYGRERFRHTKAPFLAERVQLKAAGRQLVVWGAGSTGRRMARALEPHGLAARAFVDIDPAKIGGQARGVPICPAEFLDPSAHVVVVAVGARGARERIRPRLKQLGFLEGEAFWFAA